MVKLFSSTVVIILAFTMLACEAPMTFMSGGEEQDEVTIKSIESGAFIGSEEEIPLSLHYNKDNVTLQEFTVELLSHEGEIIGTQKLDEKELRKDTLPTIKLPDLESGYYRLKYRGYDREGEIRVEQIIDFFYVNGVYSVNNITSYPPTITPGTEALLSARLQYPNGTDPFLRWTMDGTVLNKGFVSEGYDKLHWDAPEVEGVYSVKLELFPFAPTDNASFNFQSESYMEAEIFVTQRSGGSGNATDPNYYSVLHFQGNWLDTGSRPNKETFEPIGNPSIDVRGNVFGYYCDGTSGFKSEEILLPFNDRFLAPFTLSMKMYLDKKPESVLLFQTADDEGNFQFRVYTDKNGKLQSTVRYNGIEITSRSGLLLSPDTMQKISLSLIPSENDVTMIWYLDGIQKRIEKKERFTISPPTSGMSVIGGENGFVGVIDEFGVYYQDELRRQNTDPAIYRREARETYGSDLIYAEGFDGLYLPEAFQSEEAVSIKTGELVLGPESSVSFPQFAIAHEKITFELQHGPTGGLSSRELRIVSTDDRFGPLTVRLNGTVLLEDDDTVVQFSRENGSITVEFLHNEEGITVFINKDEITTYSYETDDIPISVTLTNRDKSKTFSLKRMLVYSTSLRVVKKEAASESALTHEQLVSEENPTQS